MRNKISSFIDGMVSSYNLYGDSPRMEQIRANLKNRSNTDFLRQSWEIVGQNMREGMAIIAEKK